MSIQAEYLPQVIIYSAWIIYLFIYFYFYDFRDGVTQLFLVNSHNKIQGNKTISKYIVIRAFSPF